MKIMRASTPASSLKEKEMNICSTSVNRHQACQAANPLNAGAALPEDSRASDLDHASILLTEALNAAHNAPDIRRDRVEAIRAQIESGAYEIDSRKLAESLIRENPDLFDDWK